MPDGNLIVGSSPGPKSRKNLAEGWYPGFPPQSQAVAAGLPEPTTPLDFPRLDLRTVLRPLGPDDDLLGEMLDEAWS